MTRLSTPNRTGEAVTCLACGETVSREDTREYDKHGDRFSREGKSFEFRSKPSDRASCHQPRDGLGATLIAANAGETTREQFLAEFCRLDHAVESSPNHE